MLHSQAKKMIFSFAERFTYPVDLVEFDLPQLIV